MSSQRFTLTSLVLGAAVAALCTAAPAFGQNPTIVSGKVVAATGQPLPEVSVSIPELQLGGVTRGDGSYSFTVSAERGAGRTVTLTARLVGFHPSNVQITLTPGSVTQNFSLALNPLQLGVVVVTGQGTTSTTEQLGTARSNVTPVEIQKSNEPNIITALAAKSPGINVQESSGEPGVSTYIQLRGLTTLTAGDGQPLIVVDGMPVDNSIQQTPGFAPGLAAAANGGPAQTDRAMDINPDDIENVEILKGAAAGAIYGSRAGQGVILITTKHGHAGQTHYTAKSSTSWDNVSNLPFLQQQYGMGTGGKTFACGNTPNCSPPNRGASWGALLPAGTTTYDHANEMFTTGHVYDDAITASGGNDKTTFYLSGAYDYNRGMIVGPNNAYGRTSLRFNGSHQMTSDLRLSTEVAFAASNGAYVNSSNNVSSLLLGAWRTPPEFDNLPFLAPNGEPRSTRFENPTATSYYISRVYDNPFFVAYEQKSTSNVARTFGDVKGDYQPLPWLRFNEQLGADYSNDERLYSNPWTSGATSGFTGSGNVAPGVVVAGFTKSWSIDQSVSATATHTFSKNFDGSLTVGNNINIKEYNTQASQGNGLTAPQPYTLGNTSIAQSPITYTSDVRLASFFGQAQGTLWRQLTLTGALRDDGASTFGPNKQFSLFPKGSVAWNVIRDGDNGNKWLTSLKLRTAYGESGTQPKPYVLGATYASQAYSDGFSNPISTSSVNGQGGLASNALLPNPNLTSERQKEWEMGTDIAFLRTFGDVSFTYYRETTIGAIFPVSVPAYGGYSTEYENAANLWNHGFEVALNLRPIQTRLLSWDVGLNWARNRSDITSLPNGVQFVDIGGTGGLGGITGAAVKGQQAPVYYGTDYVRCGRGVILNGQNIDKVPGECLGAKKGALYIDASGYPQLDDANQYVIGDPNRNWIGSFRTSIRVQKLSVSALLDVQNGGDSYNGTSLALNYFGRSYDTQLYRDCNCTVKFGQTYLGTSAGAAGEGAGKGVALGQSWFQGPGGVFNGASSYAVQHSGFAKLREISVAYTFDMPAIQRLTTFSSIEVRLSGRNLHTWTSYTGIDPETSILGSASPVRGIDYFNIPQDRSYVITFSLNH